MPYQARCRENQADLRAAFRRASTSPARPSCEAAAASQSDDYEHAQLARRPPWRTRPRRSRVRPSSLCLALMEQVERGAERAASRAVAIAHKRMADDLERYAVLQGDAGHDRAVTRGSVGVGTALAVGEEHLGERAVGESADGRDIAQATDFKIERFGQAAIRQAAAGHDRPRCWSHAASVSLRLMMAKTAGATAPLSLRACSAVSSARRSSAVSGILLRSSARSYTLLIVIKPKFAPLRRGIFLFRIAVMAGHSQARAAASRSARRRSSRSRGIRQGWVGPRR